MRAERAAWGRAGSNVRQRGHKVTRSQAAMTMLAILVALVLVLHQVDAYAPALRTVCSRRSSSSSSSRLYMAGFGAKKVDAAAATAPPNPSAPCACGSGAKYSDCCEPFHSGKSVPPTPVKVVRSRFSALVYKLTPYMIATTHASHKEYVDEEQKSKRKIWEKDLKAFADEYDFRSIAFEDEARDSVVAADALQATVAFSAKLQRVGLGERPPEEMKELSVFKRDSPTSPWLYADATIKNPFKNMQPVVKPTQRAVKTLAKGVPNGNQG